MATQTGTDGTHSEESIALPEEVKGYARWAENIANRMSAEGAVSLSNAEIERTLKDCVCGHRLIPLAKGMRNAGMLIARTDCIDVVRS